MPYELTPQFITLLVAIGGLAGVINTLAGGGSNLTLPALMVLGLPADVANATNRVGVLVQAVTVVRGFDRHQQLPRGDLWAVVWPTVVGSVLGSAAAAFAPTVWLKPALLTAMLGMAALVLLRPDVVAPPPGTTPYRVDQRPSARWVLLLAGVYGGFVQAGVGFILIAALAGALRYDLVKTNALKMLCTLFLTVVSMALFIWQDMVAWVPGLVLALGTMIGGRLGVRLALKASQRALKWFLFVMTLCASAAAMWL